MIFHHSIGFPSTFRRPIGNFYTKPSRHAIARAQEKRIDIPRIVNLSDFDIIELEITNGRIAKMVIRGEYDDYDDICMAVNFDRGSLFIRTVWLNDINDTHNTLDTSKYGRP